MSPDRRALARKVWVLAKRATVDGERKAAEEALGRILAREGTTREEWEWSEALPEAKESRVARWGGVVVVPVTGATTWNGGGWAWSVTGGVVP